MQAGKVNYELESRIAEHIAKTRWLDLPPRAQEQAVRAILWWLATGLEGMSETDQFRVLDYVRMQGGKQEATILGTGIRTTAELAALANGRSGKALEQEDKYWVDETIGFAVGCCVVPAAIAAAEAKGGVTGKEIATAVALGIDLEARILRPLGLGFVLGRSAANATFAMGTYGAAAAAAKVLGLDHYQIMDALGIAHCRAAGNYQGQVEGRGVSLQAGFAVQNGLSAARFASIGMPGPRAWLTGSVGLYAVHYPGQTADFENVAAGLGTEFLNVNLGFKGYPCGVVAHPAIDAVLAARRDVNGRQISSIEVFGPPSLNIMAVPIEVKRAPKSAIEAQFSIPWAAACAMRDGEFTTDHYGHAVLDDEQLQDLAGKVTVHMSEEYRGNRVVVTLTDGTTVEPPLVTASKGHPNNPLATEEIEQLLARNAKRLDVPNGAVEQVVALMRRFEGLTDISEVMNLLRSPTLAR